MINNLLSTSTRLVAFWSRAENIFLIFATIFGIAFTVVSAPFQAADEYQHFYRAYVISKGQIFSADGTMPLSLRNLTKVTVGVPFNSEKKIHINSILPYFYTPLEKEVEVLIAFPSVMHYSPIPYFAQAIGCIVGRALSLPPAALFYLVRLFNLSFWILISYLAIKITPIYKWVFVALLLTPMTLFQAASVSADVFSNAFAFVLIAYCFCLSSHETDKMTNLNYILLIALVMLLALTKPPYAMLASLVLIIPSKKYPSLKKQVIFLAVFFLFTLLITLASVSIGAKVDYSTLQGGMDIRPMDQALFIVTHPKSILVVIYNTLKDHIYFYWQSYVGILGWMDTSLRDWVYQTYLIFLIAVCLFDNRKDIRVAFWQKSIGFLCSLGMFVGVLLALYITWSHYQAAVIQGLQGRYLIPITPPLTFALYNNRFRWNKISIALVLFYLPVVLASTIQSILLRFYLF